MKSLHRTCRQTQTLKKTFKRFVMCGKVSFFFLNFWAKLKKTTFKLFVKFGKVYSFLKLLGQTFKSSCSTEATFQWAKTLLKVW